MRFTFVLSGLFAVLAAAADSGSATVSVDPAQKSQLACLDKCPTGDVNCQAHCITVPSPDQSQANATTQCAAKCPQGNGSPADTRAFAACIDKCIHEHYYVTSKGTPEPTGAPGGNNAASGSGSGSGTTAAAPSGSSGSDSDASGTGSGSGASETGTATTGSSSGTRTGSAATTSTTNAAPAIIASGGALVGVIAALLAL